METQNNLHVPTELLAELQTLAVAGKSVEQLAAETLRQGLEERAWQDLFAYGHQRAAASGYTQDDIPRVIREWRQTQRR